MSLGGRLKLGKGGQQRRPRNLLTARGRRTAGSVARRSDTPQIATGSGPNLQRFGVPAKPDPSLHAVDEHRGGPTGPSLATPRRLLLPSFRDKLRGLHEHLRPLPERRQSRPRFTHEGSEAGFGRLYAKDADQRRLAGGRVLAGSLT